MAGPSAQVVLDRLHPRRPSQTTAAPQTPPPGHVVAASGLRFEFGMFGPPYKVCPPNARIGNPISSAQQRVLDLLDSQIEYLLCVPAFVADSLGRSADKFLALSKILEELPSDNLGIVDLVDWAAVLHEALLPYQHFKPASEGCSNAPSQHEDVSAPKRFINFQGSSHLAVHADRIKWRYAPSFDPCPYLDPVLRSAYTEPELLRRSPGDWPALPPARVHCSRQELLKLAQKWDDLGSLVITPVSELDWDEAVGLFSVGKSATHDRLIVNPVVSNSRSFTISRFSKSLAPGSLLTLLHLQPDLGFRFCADDLSDYYYSFQVSRSRAKKNSIRCKFEPAELLHLRAAQGLDMVGPQALSLNTMAMGDSLAVEVGQAAHYRVLREHASALLPSQTLLYRQAVPKTDFVELLAIDDHVGLQKLPLCKIPDNPVLQDTRVFARAEVAYDHVGLRLNDDKKRRNLVHGTILGAEVDGVLGIVGPPRDRMLSLASLTASLAKRGSATRELIEKLLGCWVHALMFRRPVFCVFDSLFREGRTCARNEVFKISDQSRNELLMLACLSPTIVSDLRATYDSSLYCLDASPSGGAVCAADIGSDASAELWRHGELRGYHTRLESEVSALLTEKGISHESDNLFGAQSSVPEELLSQPHLDSFVPNSLSEGAFHLRKLG